MKPNETHCFLEPFEPAFISITELLHSTKTPEEIKTIQADLLNHAKAKGTANKLYINQDDELLFDEIGFLEFEDYLYTHMDKGHYFAIYLCLTIANRGRYASAGTEEHRQ